MLMLGLGSGAWIGLGISSVACIKQSKAHRDRRKDASLPSPLSQPQPSVGKVLLLLTTTVPINVISSSTQVPTTLSTTQTYYLRYLPTYSRYLQYHVVASLTSSRLRCVRN